MTGPAAEPGRIAPTGPIGLLSRDPRGLRCRSGRPDAPELGESPGSGRTLVLTPSLVA